MFAALVIDIMWFFIVVDKTINKARGTISLKITKSDTKRLSSEVKVKTNYGTKKARLEPSLSKIGVSSCKGRLTTNVKRSIIMASWCGLSKAKS